MKGKKFIAGSLLVCVVGVTGSGLLATSASAQALPQQKAAAAQSLATAQVLDAGAHPQFLHDIANDVVAGVTGAVGAKVVETAVKVTTKLVPKSSSDSSSSSSESSSSSSGGPATAPNGAILADVQFDAAQ